MNLINKKTYEKIFNKKKPKNLYFKKFKKIKKITKNNGLYFLLIIVIFFLLIVRYKDNKKKKKDREDFINYIKNNNIDINELNNNFIKN